MNNGFEMQLFGSQQRKPFLKITAHLVTEYTDCTGTCAVSFLCAIFKNMCEEILVDFQSPAI